MTGAACVAGNAYPSGATDFIPCFHRGLCCPVIWNEEILFYSKTKESLDCFKNLGI